MTGRPDADSEWLLAAYRGDIDTDAAAHACAIAHSAPDLLARWPEARKALEDGDFVHSDDKRRWAPVEMGPPAVDVDPDDQAHWDAVHPNGQTTIDTGEPEPWPSPSDPMGVARRVARQWNTPDKAVMLRRHWRGGWIQWRPSGRWADLEDAAVRAELYALLEDAMCWKETGSGPKLAPWRPTRPKVANVAEALAAIVHLPSDTNPPTWLQQHNGINPHEIVSCANGFLHVTTRQLLDHDPRFFTRVAVPFPYQADAGEPTSWLGFLHDLWPTDPEAIAALQEFFGYVLSGHTYLHKILGLIGPTRSGKGTIARVLTALLGNGNVAGPTLTALATNFGLQPLIDRPLAVVSDARLGGAAAHQTVERLLSISGEDTITIDRKYQPPWTGRLGTRFVILSNELPNFGDASGAIARRFILLTMTRSWLGRENTDLDGLLAEELPAILNWSLDGLERLNQRGHFTEPRSSKDAIVALQDLGAPVSAFLRDNCEQGPGYEIPIDQLYEAWKAWCDGHGNKPGTSAWFGRNLRAAVPALGTAQHLGPGGTRPRYYIGLRLKEHETW